MPLFLDACALAKHYLPEGRSTQTVRTILDRAGRWGGLNVSSLIEPEVVSAMARFVRDRPMPEQKQHAVRQHPRMVELFRKHYRAGSFSVIPVDNAIVNRATELLRDTPLWNIGGADAIHLATALEARSTMGSTKKLVFVTADQGLYEAAKASGLAVHNPNYQSPHDLERIFGG